MDEFGEYFHSVETMAFLHGHPQFSGKRKYSDSIRASLLSIARQTAKSLRVKKKAKHAGDIFEALCSHSGKQFSLEEFLQINKVRSFNSALSEIESKKAEFFKGLEL